jgi:hypothetical protein
MGFNSALKGLREGVTDRRYYEELKKRKYEENRKTE